MLKPADTKLTCVARRHMTPATFVTYDAMLASCKSNEKYKPGDPLIFWGSEYTLANLNNRGKDAESDALDRLESDGWIISTQAGQRRKDHAGTFTTNEWRVVEHDEWARTHGACPGPRYVKVETKWKPVTPGTLPRSLETANIRKYLQASGLTFVGELGGQLLDGVVDMVRAKRETTVAENSATAHRNGKLRDGESTVTENSVTTVAENSVTTVAEDSVTTVAENSATSLSFKPEQKARTESRTNQPPTSENGQTDGRPDGLAASSPSLSLKDKGNSQDDDQWTKFLSGVKADVDAKSWVLYGETKEKVRNVVKENGADAVLEALDDWKETRRPLPSSGLDHPWLVFLREYEEEIKDWARALQKDRERKR